MQFVSRAQKKRDRNGLRNKCCACGFSGTGRDPLVLTDTGFRVHLSHITDPGGVLYGRRQL